MKTKNTHPIIKKIVLLLTMVFISSGIYAQLTVSTAMTPQQLVQNILVGTGVTVSNITYTGAAGTIGSFTTGGSPTNLGFSSGIIMASGLVNGTPTIGSAASNFASTQTLYPAGSDPDLQVLIPASPIYDASVLEFDFVPLSDTIKFRYVFGSEEYPEWVNSTFNDVFGFFVNGPNPLGGNYTSFNIAKVPSTTIPVAINNVNNGTANTGPCTNCAYYVDNSSGGTIVYDGFTTVLTAWCLVLPCQPYHLKLAIGDAGDGSYDSGVFLEANSFSAPTVSMQTTFSTPTVSTSNAVEGCNNAIINFSLPNVQSAAFPISYAIAGTATNGVDYTTIQNYVIIPAGQSSVNLVISPIIDGVTEPTETVMLIVQTSICGGTDTVIVNILNNDPFSIQSSNDTTICGGSASIWVQATGGITPYTYLWDNGIGNTSGATVSPTTSTTYNVTVTDLCGASATESIVISVGSSFANAGPDVTLCVGESTTLTATGGTNFLWSTGETTPSITVSPTITTTYGVSVTGTCGSVDSVTVTVNPLPDITATSTPASVVMGSSSQICASGGDTYNWSSNPPDPSLLGQINNACANVTPPNTTTYMVTGIDTNGCQNSATTIVVVIPIYPEVDFWGEPLSGCVPLRVQFYDNSTKTVPGSTYYWDFGNGTYSYDQNPVAYYLEDGTYDVRLTVSNPGGMAATLQMTDYVVAYPNPIAMFSTAPENSTTILDPIFHFYDYSLGSPNQWYWTFGDGFDDTQQNTHHNYSDGDYYYQFPLMEDTGTYLITLIVTTEHGCRDTASKFVHIEPTYSLLVPNAFTPNGDEKNQNFCVSEFGVLRENYNMVIFDRWGQKVFYSTNIEECWNGRVNNS
ncbi:MAG: choice-of-anchor L domain-containing protein, partial [Bacteroidota bacterium]